MNLVVEANIEEAIMLREDKMTGNGKWANHLPMKKEYIQKVSLNE